MTERWRYQLRVLLEEIDEGRVNEWEREFLYSLATRLEADSDYQLSEKQTNVLERIWREKQ